MNLWGSFRDSSEAHDCIFINTFCFSLIIIYRLEMAMRPISCKMVCTFPEFFIQHCQLFSSKAGADITYQGTNLWSRWSIFQKEIFYFRKTEERDMQGFQNGSIAEAEYQLPFGGLIITPKQHFKIELLDKTSHQSAHFFNLLNTITGKVCKSSCLNSINHWRDTFYRHIKKKNNPTTTTGF